MVSKVPGSAEVARGVPRLRGTVSGCLSHSKVFRRGREHAKLLTIANGRRRSKAVTEPADVSETTVGGGMGSTTRENGANPSAVPSTADPGRPLSPLLSFVSHIFDSASDRLRRRLSSVRRLHDVDFETASCRFTRLMDRGVGWTCRSCLAHRACGVMVSRLSGWHWSGHFRRPSSCGIRRAEGETGAGRVVLVWNYMLQPSARPQGVPVGPQSTCHAPDRGACALRIPLPLGLNRRVCPHRCFIRDLPT